MRLVEPVRHVRQLFARHIKQVGVLEVSGGQDEAVAGDHGAARWACAAGIPAGRRDAPQPRRRVYVRTLRPLGAHHAAVVLERLLAGRLGAGAAERVAADFEPFGRRKEGHPDRVANDRVGNRAGIDHQVADAATVR